MSPTHPIGREFEAWAQKHQYMSGANYPHPSAPDALPDGWHVRTTSSVVKNGRTLIQSLVSRDAGGWMILRHTSDAMDPERNGISLDEQEETFEDLYEVVRYMLTNTLTPRWGCNELEEMLRVFVGSHFETEDTREAGEQVVVALGAHPTFLPTALTGDEPARIMVSG